MQCCFTHKALACLPALEISWFTHMFSDDQISSARQTDNVSIPMNGWFATRPRDIYVNLFSVNQQVGGWVGWIRVGITAPLSLCFSCHWNARRSEQSSLCLKLKHAISTFKTFWCSTADKDANNPDSENEDKKLGMCGKFWDRRSRGGVDKQTLRLGRDGRVGARQRTAH